MNDEITIAVAVKECEAHLELTGFYYDEDNQEPNEHNICFFGEIKWNGCAEWFSFHTCSTGEFVAICMAKAKAYEMAIKHFSNNQGSKYEH